MTTWVLRAEGLLLIVVGVYYFSLGLDPSQNVPARYFQTFAGVPLNVILSGVCSLIAIGCITLGIFLLRIERLNQDESEGNIGQGISGNAGKQGSVENHPRSPRIHKDDGA